MTIARREIVAEGVEGLYHCVSRCVRRAFLCGQDVYSGRSYEHRKDWVKSRLQNLASGFAIEVCAFAIMSNHIHLILHTKPNQVAEWSDQEIARRWLLVFPKRNTSKENEIRRLARNKEFVEEIRPRLSSISWFMRCLNEFIARCANKEDDCKGRFWEGRFKCQALLDEAAVLACMAYVDLNPVRAGLADSPETSEFTSIYDRIMANRARVRLQEEVLAATNNSGNEQYLSMLGKQATSDRWLSPLGSGGEVGSSRGCISISLNQYLTLVDWTGRQIKEGRKGKIPDHYLPILDRLDIESDRWLDTVAGFGGLFCRVAGKVASIRKAAQRAGRQWLRGLNSSRQAFSQKIAA